MFSLFNNRKVKKLNKKASILLENKEYEKAVEYSNKSLKIKPENLQALEFKFDALLNLHPYEKFMNLSNEIIKSHPDTLTAQLVRGHILLNNGKYEEGIKDFNKYLEKEVDDYILSRKYYALIKLNKQEEAEKTFQQLLDEIDVEIMEALLTICALSHENELYEEEEFFYKMGLEREPNNPDFLIYKAIKYIETENMECAEKYVDKILNTEPWNVDALNFKALLYLEHQEYLKAKGTFEFVLDLDPDNESAKYGLKNCI